MKTPKFVHAIHAVALVTGEVVKTKVEHYQNLHAGKKVVKADIASMGAQLREAQEITDALAKEKAAFEKDQKDLARKAAREQAEAEAHAAKVQAEIEKAAATIAAAQAVIAELTTKEEVNHK